MQLLILLFICISIYHISVNTYLAMQSHTQHDFRTDQNELVRLTFLDFAGFRVPGLWSIVSQKVYRDPRPPVWSQEVAQTVDHLRG